MDNNIFIDINKVEPLMKELISKIDNNLKQKINDEDKNILIEILESFYIDTKNHGYDKGYSEGVKIMKLIYGVKDE